MHTTESFGNAWLIFSNAFCSTNIHDGDYGSLFRMHVNKYTKQNALWCDMLDSDVSPLSAHHLVTEDLLATPDQFSHNNVSFGTTARHAD